MEGLISPFGAKEKSVVLRLIKLFCPFFVSHVSFDNTVLSKLAFFKSLIIPP